MPFRLAAVTAVALFCTSLYPIPGQIITSDEGVWPESWRRDYGWPRRVYREWGYDPRIRMQSWDPEGILYNGRVLVIAAAGVFGVAVAVLPVARKRRRIVDS